MTETIQIYIDHNGETHLVGHLHYNSRTGRQNSTFNYADNWLGKDDAFALDPANLPLRNDPIYTNFDKSALPGALRDTAPDRWGQQLIKRAIGKSGNQRTLSEIDYLLAINDLMRIGALRYRRKGEGGFDQKIDDTRVPPPLQLSELLNAADAVQGNNETAEHLKLLLNEGSPLGGARPKSAIVDKDGTLAIAKFPKKDEDRSIPHGEILALTLAKKAGINAAMGRLERVKDRPVALITRFDRDSKTRIPFLSAMSLLKKNDGEEATYTDIAECIRMYSSAPTDDLHELWRRVVFSVKIGNLDDHLRNHGFLYDGDDKWRLSPAYDLNPVPLIEKNRELITWISEEGPEADIRLAVNAAPHFKINKDKAAIIINEVESAMVSWRDIARKLGMSSPDLSVYETAIQEEDFNDALSKF
jgi:serine/threonine-protein kinase HipA